MKNSINKEIANIDFDQKAYNKEKLKYPMQETLRAGYPRWNHPNNRVTRELLEEDTKEGSLYREKKITPKQLREKRLEYQKYPDKIFRDRLYKAKSKHIEQPYWQNKRNKSMRKKKMVEENMLQQGWL